VVDQPPDKSPVWWTTQQIAARWQMSEDTVLRLIHAEKLIGQQLGKRLYRVHKDDLAAYEARDRQAAPAKRRQRAAPSRAVTHDYFSADVLARVK
jgi:excisionase family DNA binding protein